ncbi:MAG: GAF domain-containing protein [Proteobacteria bacterium]|nr:GAF domain-containing protein [Pseudomonadota bacterium]
MAARILRTCVWLASTQNRILFLLLLAVAPVFALIFYSAYEERLKSMQELLEHSHGMLVNLGRLAAVRGEAGAGPCDTLLAETLQMHDQYQDLIVADSAGRIRCSASPVRMSTNLPEQDYFKNALKLRSFVIGDYQFSPISGKGTLPLAEPVINSRGGIAGVVSVNIDLAWLQRMLLRTELPSGSVLSLLDGQGNLLADYQNTTEQIGHGTAEWKQLTAIHKESKDLVTERKLSDKVERLMLVTSLAPPGYGGNLYLWIGVPSKILYSEINRNLNRNLFLMAITAILALGRVMGSRLLLRRIEDLSQTARRLSSGDLAARTMLPADQSEFGQLSAAFNKIGETLGLREASIKRSDEELRRANRAFGVLSAVNRSLIGAADEQALLDNVCEEIVGIGHYPLAWIGYSDAGEDRRIRIMAKAGNDQGYLDKLELTWGDQPSGRGPTGTTIRTGQSVIIRNIALDPQFVTWRDAALQRGYASTTSLPIVVSGALIGALRIYAPEVDAFDS